jgi:hypothetical protein
MKNLLKLFCIALFSTFFLTNCDPDSDFQEKLIRAEVVDFNPLKADSAIFMDYQLDSDFLFITEFHEIGRCKISEKGKFSGYVNSPVYTYSIKERIHYPFIISDSTARIAYLIIRAFKAGKYMGNFVKCNSSYLINPVGNSYSIMIFSTKDLSVTGIDRTRYNFHREYDLKLKKGWNEVFHNQQTIINGFNTIRKETITNRAFEELKWRFVNNF